MIVLTIGAYLNAILAALNIAVYVSSNDPANLGIGVFCGLGAIMAIIQASS